MRVSEDQDATRQNFGVFRIDVGPDNNYYNHEFTLVSPEGNRLSWIVGASGYYRFTPVQVAIDRQFPGSCGYNRATGAVRPCPTRGEQGIWPQAIRNDGDTWQRHSGIYGQLTYDINDTLEFEFGVRNSWDINDASTTTYVGIYGPPPRDCSDPFFTAQLPEQNTYLCVNPNLNRFSEYKESEPTWKIGLNATPYDEHFFYVFWSRGNKSGGVNNGRRFEQEIIDDYELGWKATLLDGQMQVQFGGFYMDYQQMQQQGFLVEPSTLAETLTKVLSSTSATRRSAG